MTDYTLDGARRHMTKQEKLTAADDACYCCGEVDDPDGKGPAINTGFCAECNSAGCPEALTGSLCKGWVRAMAAGENRGTQPRSVSGADTPSGPELCPACVASRDRRDDSGKCTCDEGQCPSPGLTPSQREVEWQTREACPSFTAERAEHAKTREQMKNLDNLHREARNKFVDERDSARDALALALAEIDRLNAT